VINEKIDNDYVKTWQQFQFLPNALEAIKQLSKHFGKIIIITNQRGVGRKLMTEDDLKQIHSLMLEKIKNAGGRIDKIYYCPHLEEVNCNCRKPKTGMALQAKIDFPVIDFEKSVIVGDSQPDLDMGQRLGMTTVLIGLENRKTATFNFCFKKMFSFAKEIHFRNSL